MNIQENSLFNQMKEISTYVDKRQSTLAVGRSFTNILSDAIEAVNSIHKQSGKATRAFELGDKGISLSEVQIIRAKSGVVTEATIQVRNKAIEGYKEIMNMQL